MNAPAHLVHAETQAIVRPPVRPAGHAQGKLAAPGNQSRLNRLQAKLSVSTPGDRYEVEADQVADQVMRMSASGAHPRVGSLPATPQTTPKVQRLCSACEDEQAQRKEASAAGEVSTSAVTPSGPGQPLSTPLRGFFEPRFGHSFADVRVHTGGEANQSARSVNALAYTTGADIVFADGQFDPASRGGQHLLAHELTHVIQQQGASRSVQRSCGAGVVAPPGCVPDPTITPPTTKFLFNPNCDDFAPGQELALETFARAIPSGATVDIVGLASFEQPASDPTLNDRLSCMRAEQGAAVIRRAAPGAARIGSVRATGGVPGTANDTTMRAVGIEVSTPVDLPNCGPDATDWFVTQVNTAASDPAVLSVQADFAAADSLARSHGTTVADFAEAGALTAIEAQEARLTVGTAFGGPPPPARAGAIVGQTASGAVSRSRALGALPAAIRADPFNAPGIIADFAAMNVLLASGALKWRALVNHAARYDFKMHADSMHLPHAPGCPDEACPAGEHGTITLCPGSNAENCYESDLPGNLFYARIGRLIGMSELTLQLGSQFAEITDLPRAGRPVITWDTPDDTAAIALGFALPLPLTRSALCSALGPARATLASRTGCEDCLSSVEAALGGSAVIR
jgi:hypothetical protein